MHGPEYVSLGDGRAAVNLPADQLDQLRALLARFITALENGMDGRGPLSWSPRKDRMFPPAYDDRRRSKVFRERNSNDLRRGLLLAARRMQQDLPDRGGFTLEPGDVANWFKVFGHMQSLFISRSMGRLPPERGSRGGAAMWLMYHQNVVACAAMDHVVHEFPGEKCVS